MQPNRYVQRPEEELGYLRCKKSSLPNSAQRINHIALQALVAQRWQDFASDRASSTCADKLRRRWLLRRYFSGISDLVRTKQRIAAVHQQKRQYLYLVAAFSAWRKRIKYKKYLTSKSIEAVVLFQRLLFVRTYHGWLRAVCNTKYKQHQWTRAVCYHAFSSMAKALDTWREWLHVKQRKRYDTKIAFKHLARSRKTSVFWRWRSWVCFRSQHRRRMELASTFDHIRVLSSVWGGWRMRVLQTHELRAQAAKLIQSVLYGLDVRLMALCVRSWRVHTAHKSRLRHCQYIAHRLYRFNTLQHYWQGWRERQTYRRHLQQLHTRLEIVQPKLLLHCALRTWGDAVWELQLEASQLYYRALQLPRIFVTWRNLASQTVQLAELEQACRAAHQHLLRRHCLDHWCSWASGRSNSRLQMKAALEWQMARMHRQVLLGWWQWVQHRLADCRKAQQASDLHAKRVQRAVLLRWRRFSRCRRLSACWHEHRLRRETFAGWRRHAQYKNTKVLEWRRAVRHRYLHLLCASMHTFQLSLAQAREQHLRAVAHSHCSQQRVVLQVLCAWQGPFLHAARDRRAQLVAAHAHWQHTALRRVIVAWRGPFLGAMRSRHKVWQQAKSLWRMSLLHSALQGWKQGAAVKRASREHVDDLRRHVQVGRTGRLLRGWGKEAQRLSMKREQVAFARTHRQAAVRAAVLRTWRGYRRAKQRRHHLWLEALLLRSRQLLRWALWLWQDATRAAAILRRVGLIQDGRTRSSSPQAQGRQPEAFMRPNRVEDQRLASLLDKLAGLKSTAAQHMQCSQGKEQAQQPQRAPQDWDAHVQQHWAWTGHAQAAPSSYCSWMPGGCHADLQPSRPCAPAPPDVKRPSTAVLSSNVPRAPHAAYTSAAPAHRRPATAVYDENAALPASAAQRQCHHGFARPITAPYEKNTHVPPFHPFTHAIPAETRPFTSAFHHAAHVSASPAAMPLIKDGPMERPQEQAGSGPVLLTGPSCQSPLPAWHEWQPLGGFGASGYSLAPWHPSPTGMCHGLKFQKDGIPRCQPLHSDPSWDALSARESVPAYQGNPSQPGPGRYGGPAAGVCWYPGLPSSYPAGTSGPNQECAGLWKRTIGAINGGGGGEQASTALSCALWQQQGKGLDFEGQNGAHPVSERCLGERGSQGGLTPPVDFRVPLGDDFPELPQPHSHRPRWGHQGVDVLHHWAEHDTHMMQWQVQNPGQPILHAGRCPKEATNLCANTQLQPPSPVSSQISTAQQLGYTDASVAVTGRERQPGTGPC